MHKILPLLAGTLLLTSCGLFGHYERDAKGVDSLTQKLYRDPAQADAALTTTDTASFGNMPWQQVFTDAKLQALIRKALVQNTDLRKTALTIKQAEIGLRVNKLAYLPQIAFSPSGTLSKAFIDGSNLTKTYNLPVQASWQIDAFGTLYNAKKQAELSLVQAKVARRATQTASTLVLWHKNITAMEAMKEAGMTNAAALASAKAQVLQIESTVPTLEDNIRQLENSLAVLLHEAPHAIDRNPFTADGFPTTFSTGVPLSLLANRPDVAIAEAKLASTFYGVQAARGQFFPQITISGQGAFTNSLGGMIMNPGKFLASGIASLTQPLFAQGKIKAGYEVAKLQQEAAQLDFEQALLTAGQEVSNALAAYHTACTTTDIAQLRLGELQKANDDTEFLFRNGNTTSYLETLTAQMNLLNGRLSLINNRYDKVQAVIKLYQALGGGRQ